MTLKSREDYARNLSGANLVGSCSQTAQKMRSSLPPRFRESSFRNFEADIAIIVDSFPHVVQFTVFHGYQATTFSARLRDAIQSFHLFQWPSTMIDKIKFRAAHSAGIIVSHSATEIVAGGRDELREYKAAQTIQQEPNPLDAVETLSITPGTVHLGELSEQELLLLATLVSKKLLKCPICVSCLTPELIAKLEDNFDLIITPNTDGTHTFL